MARRRDAGTERPAPIPDDQVIGRRFIRLLDGQLRQLRDHCKHGNRSFFYDQLVVAHLRAFFNPILAGWRKIEDVFDLPAVRKRLKMPRLPKSASCERLEPRPLTAADRATGVLTDTLVRLGWRDNRWVALLCQQCSAVARRSRVKHCSQSSATPPLRLLTNRLDLPAETLGVIDRHRWPLTRGERSAFEPPARGRSPPPRVKGFSAGSSAWRTLSTFIPNRRRA